MNVNGSFSHSRFWIALAGAHHLCVKPPRVYRHRKFVYCWCLWISQCLRAGLRCGRTSINRRQTCISLGRFSVMADFCYKWGNIIPVLVRLRRMCVDAKHGSSFQSTKRDLILSLWLDFQCCFVLFVKGFTVTNSQWIFSLIQLWDVKCFLSLKICK